VAVANRPVQRITCQELRPAKSRSASRPDDVLSADDSKNDGKARVDIVVLLGPRAIIWMDMAGVGLPSRWRLPNYRESASASRCLAAHRLPHRKLACPTPREASGLHDHVPAAAQERRIAASADGRTHVAVAVGKVLL
jgi:hypothetical protein